MTKQRIIEKTAFYDELAVDLWNSIFNTPVISFHTLITGLAKASTACIFYEQLVNFRRPRLRRRAHLYTANHFPSLH